MRDWANYDCQMLGISQGSGSLSRPIGVGTGLGARIVIIGSTPPQLKIIGESLATRGWALGNNNLHLQDRVEHRSPRS